VVVLIDKCFIFRFSNIAYEVGQRDFEVSKDPYEWAFVERLFPPELKPAIPVLDEYPSGFKPAKLKPGQNSSNSQIKAMPYSMRSLWIVILL